MYLVAAVAACRFVPRRQYRTPQSTLACMLFAFRKTLRCIVRQTKHSSCPTLNSQTDRLLCYIAVCRRLSVWYTLVGGRVGRPRLPLPLLLSAPLEYHLRYHLRRWYSDVPGTVSWLQSHSTCLPIVLTSHPPSKKTHDRQQAVPGKAKITSLRVYPVKSCAGHEVQQAALGDRGLEMDRLWMIVDGRGRFMSQRRFSKLALVSPSLPKSKDEVGAESVRRCVTDRSRCCIVLLYGSLPCSEDGMRAAQM